MRTQIIHKQERLAIVLSQIFPMQAMAANFFNYHHIFHISAKQYSDTNTKLYT